MMIALSWLLPKRVGGSNLPAMATHITGKGDGPNGENETYTVWGRGEVSRAKLVAEVKAGIHPNHSIYTRNGVEYVRSNPDPRTSNNVNKD